MQPVYEEAFVACASIFGVLCLIWTSGYLGRTFGPSTGLHVRVDIQMSEKPHSFFQIGLEGHFESELVDADTCGCVPRNAKTEIGAAPDSSLAIFLASPAKGGFRASSVVCHGAPGRCEQPRPCPPSRVSAVPSRILSEPVWGCRDLWSLDLDGSLTVGGGTGNFGVRPP